MKWFSSLKIGARLALCFVILFIMMIAVGVGQDDRQYSDTFDGRQQRVPRKAGETQRHVAGNRRRRLGRTLLLVGGFGAAAQREANQDHE